MKEQFDHEVYNYRNIVFPAVFKDKYIDDNYLIFKASVSNQLNDLFKTFDDAGNKYKNVYDYIIDIFKRNRSVYDIIDNYSVFQYIKDKHIDDSNIFNIIIKDNFIPNSHKCAKSAAYFDSYIKFLMTFNESHWKFITSTEKISIIKSLMKNRKFKPTNFDSCTMKMIMKMVNTDHDTNDFLSSFCHLNKEFVKENKEHLDFSKMSKRYMFEEFYTDFPDSIVWDTVSYDIKTFLKNDKNFVMKHFKKFNQYYLFKNISDFIQQIEEIINVYKKDINFNLLMKFYSFPTEDLIKLKNENLISVENILETYSVHESIINKIDCKIEIVKHFKTIYYKYNSKYYSKDGFKLNYFTKRKQDVKK